MEDMTCENEPILHAMLVYATRLLVDNKHFFSRDTERDDSSDQSLDKYLQDILTLELSSYVLEIPNDASSILQAD